MKNEYEVRGDITVVFLKRKNGTVLETLISTSDLETVKSFPNTWFCTTQGYVKGNTREANGKRVTVLLHRWILNIPKHLVVDHINHNSLDNTQENLRIVTISQNNQNKRGAYKNNISGVRGVTWDKGIQKWRARIVLGGKYYWLGAYKSINEAKKVVIEARKKIMPYAN